MDLTPFYTWPSARTRTPSKDSELSAAPLRRIGKDIGTSLLKLPCTATKTPPGKPGGRSWSLRNGARDRPDRC